MLLRSTSQSLLRLSCITTRFPFARHVIECFATSPSPASPSLRQRLAWPAPTCRVYSTTSPTANITPPDYLSEAELSIFNKLKAELKPVQLEVQDISGGCGSMFGLDIVSSRFQGLSVIKQHQLVNKVLAEEIKGWHGIQLKTRPT